MNKFVLKNTFIKIYIFYFLINIFIKQCGDRVAVLMTTFVSTEGVQNNTSPRYLISEKSH